MRLGDILMAAGIIDEADLKHALSEAALWGRRVGEVLVSQGVCDEQQILDALCRQLNVASAPLSTTVVIPDRVLSLVPTEFARKHLLVPIFDDPDAGVLEVALADPADQERLDELRFHTGREIRPFVALPSELAEAIDRFYATSPTPAPKLEIVVARTPTPAPVEADDEIEIEATGAPTEAEAELLRLRQDVDALLAAQQVLLQMLADSGAVEARSFRRALDLLLNGGAASIAS